MLDRREKLIRSVRSVPHSSREWLRAVRALVQIACAFGCGRRHTWSSVSLGLLQAPQVAEATGSSLASWWPTGSHDLCRTW